jgi:twitching motility protein PilT
MLRLWKGPAGNYSNAMSTIEDVVQEACTVHASDILLSQKSQLFFRVDGEVRPQGDCPIFIAELSRLVPRLEEALKHKSGAADFAAVIAGKRFRASVYKERTGISATLRLILDEIIPAGKLGIDPSLLGKVKAWRQGLILVTGPSGCGKSTTVNCLVEHINQTRRDHILTVEDPIEFIYTPARSAIEQRELGEHFDTFSGAIRSAVRANPDVIVVGEVRDYETVRAVLQAAETGLLVFATLHTKRVYNTISRLIGMAQAEEKEDIRSTLANNLLLIISQLLLKRAAGGRVAAREIMIQTDSTANLIREGKEKTIEGVLATHRAEGMINLASSLKNLYASSVIDAQTLAENSGAA